MESNPVPAMSQQQRVYTQEEIQSYPGKYDKDGFYMLIDGDFFDHAGFYFDKEGLDEVGGFYNENTGAYMPPPEFNDEIELDDYYDELCGSESEEEAEEQAEDDQGPGEGSDEDDKDDFKDLDEL